MELRWLVVFWHLVIANGWWCQASHGSCVRQRHKFQKDETFETKVIPLLPAGGVKPYQTKLFLGRCVALLYMLCCFSMRLVEIHEMGILTLVDPTHHHGATNSLSICFVQHFSLISIR